MNETEIDPIDEPVSGAPQAHEPSEDELSVRDRFREEGYFVLKNLLDPPSDLDPLARAYSNLIDQLARQVCGSNLETVIPDYGSLDFPSRFAGLAGVTRGSIFNHLAPALNIFERGYRFWRNAPSAQIPEFFDLLTNPKLLDVVESLIGPEVWSAPGNHLNIKLAAQHRELRDRSGILARRLKVFRKPVLEPVEFIRKFQQGQTPWHMDAFPGLGAPGTHNYIVVWVPMTESNMENGTLRVLPRSHHGGYGPFPQEREQEAVTVEAKPGDVVIMDGQTFHASIANSSQDKYRWSFNMRYMPPGGPYGRRFFPGFVARSRENPESVLNDADLWSQSWSAALDYIDRYELPLKHNFFMTVDETRKLDEIWQKRVPGYRSWLELHEHGTWWRAAWCSVRKSIDWVYGRLLNMMERWKNLKDK